MFAPVGLVLAGIGVPKVLPGTNLSLVATLPFTGTLMNVSLISGLVTVANTGAGSTKICKVAVAQVGGVPPHTV